MRVAKPSPRIHGLLAAGLLVGALLPAAAESLPRVSLSPAVDAGFAGTSLLLGAGACAFDLNEGDPLIPLSRPDPFSVNPLDRPFMLPYSKNIDTVSTALSLTALAFPAALSAFPSSDWFSQGVLYMESVALTWSLKECAKNLFPRHRPYMYYPDCPASEVENGDFRQSFPSGHTALAFTAAAFTASSYMLYYPDSPWRTPVVAGAYAVAAATASLRVASGSHFITDVLAGAALGTLSGWLVPVLHAKASGPVGTGSSGTGSSRAGSSGAGSSAAQNQRAGDLFFDILPTGVQCTFRL